MIMDILEKINKANAADALSAEGKLRIIQEIVPGKQITIAHIIAGPDGCIYQKLGLNPKIDYAKAAIGIVTLSPSESAIIAGDIAIKTSGVDLGFVDRFSGSLIVTGSFSQVDAAMKAILSYFRETMGFAVCEITRT